MHLERSASLMNQQVEIETIFMQIWIVAPPSF